MFSCFCIAITCTFRFSVYIFISWLGSAFVLRCFALLILFLAKLLLLFCCFFQCCLFRRAVSAVVSCFCCRCFVLVGAEFSVRFFWRWCCWLSLLLLLFSRSCCARAVNSRFRVVLVMCSCSCCSRVMLALVLCSLMVYFTHFALLFFVLFCRCFCPCYF